MHLSPPIGEGEEEREDAKTSMASILEHLWRARETSTAHTNKKRKITRIQRLAAAVGERTSQLTKKYSLSRLIFPHV